VGSRSKLPPFLPFDDIHYLDQLLDWGMNSIRLLFTWEGVEPEQGQYDEAYLDNLLAILDGCAERQIMVILDSHQDLFARNFCGDGFPEWTVHPDYRSQECPDPLPTWSLNYFLSPGVIQSFSRFWGDQNLKDAYLRMIAHVADRLGSHPSVMGFDLLNEPYDISYLLLNGAFEQDILIPFYKDMIAAIRQRLPEILIIFEPTTLVSAGLPTFLGPLGLPNLVFGPHWYDPIAFLLGTGVDLTGMEKRLEKMVDVARTWEAPVWIGEYGVTTSRTDNIPFLSGQIDLLEEYFVGSAIWTYNPTDVDWNLENTSFVYPGGSEKPHVNVFVRPYPARIAGTPMEFSFSFETGTLQLTYRADSASTGPTEIVIPRRNYPDGFHVEGDDGQCEWNELRRRLFYQPSQDGSVHTIRVLPGS